MVKQMKDKKITIIIGVSLLCIMGGILALLFTNSTNEQKLHGKGSLPSNALVLPDAKKVSKLDEYQQQALLQIAFTEEPRLYLEMPSIHLNDFSFPEKYQDCSGDLSFSPNGKFQNWNFQTSCGDDSSSTNTYIFGVTDPNQKLLLQEKVGKNTVMITSENLYFDSSDIGIFFFDEAYNLKWEQHIKVGETADLYVSDIYALDDGFYILGDAKGSNFLDLASISNNLSEFSFLIRYDLSGNRISTLNLTSLSSTPISSVTQIYKLEDNLLYLAGKEEFFQLEKEETLHAVEIADSDVISSGITKDHHYFGYKNVDVSSDEESSSYLGHVVYFNEDGTVACDVKMDDFMTCNEDVNCEVTDVYSISDFLIVITEYQAFILNEDGKLKEKVDYGYVLPDQENLENQSAAEVVTVFDHGDSYSIVSFADETHLYIETYSYEQKLISKSNYETYELNKLYGLSDSTVFEFDKEHFYGQFFINDPVTAFVSVQTF